MPNTVAKYYSYKSFKTVVLLFGLLLFGAFAKAQQPIKVVINVLPPYSYNIVDYSDKLLLKLINTTAQDLDVQLSAAITGINNNVSIKTRPGYKSSAPIRVPGGTSIDVDATTLYQLFDVNNVLFTGIDKNQLLQNGTIPEGDYQICMQAYKYGTNEPYSASEPVGCSNIFSLKAIEPPVITNPINGNTVPAGQVQNVIINWTAPPGAPANTQYVVKMVEVQGERNPQDAMMSNAALPVFEETVNQNIYVYGPGLPALVTGRKYALMVKAVDPLGKAVFRNNGNSEVYWFQYGDIEVPVNRSGPANVPVPGAPAPAPAAPAPANNPAPDPFPGMQTPKNSLAQGNCSQNCKVTPPVGIVSNAAIKVGDVVKVKNFSMTILELDPGGTDKLSGKATIAVPFINSNIAKLRVQFTGAQFNEKKELMAGVVKGLIHSGAASLMPHADQPDELKTLNYSKPQIANILTFLKNNPSQKIDHMVQSAGFELPLGIDEGHFSFAITDFTFKPDQASFSIATLVELPDAGTNIALTAQNVCLSDDKSLCGYMELYLAEDLKIDPLNLTLLGQKPEGDKITGTFMILDKQQGKNLEVKQFHVKAQFDFPEKSLVNAQSKAPLSTVFEFDAKNGWQNWVAELQLPEFYVYGAEDIKFALGAKKVYYDHSDLQNPVGIPAPYKSSDVNEQPIATNDNTWKGLFFPEVTVTLPEIIHGSANGDKNTVITGKNLIFDKNGFSAKIHAENLLNIGDGSLAGWYASIDSVNLEFFKSTYKTGAMNGRLILPPCGSNTDDRKNQLDYTCLLTNPKDRPLQYNFVIKPKKDLKFNALYMALELDETSQIIVENRIKKDAKGNVPDSSKTELYAEARLNGILGIDKNNGPNLGIGKFSLPDMHFQNLVIKSEAPYIDTNVNISFASPQKEVAGFKVSLKKAGFVFEPGGAGGDTKIGLRLKGDLDLLGKGENNHFGAQGETQFVIAAKITRNAAGRIAWDGLGADIEDIVFGGNAAIGPLKVKGKLKYFNNKNEGEGFVGALGVGIEKLLDVTMRTRFGKVNQQNDSYNFFDANAIVDLKKGIPFMPALNMYGFGGGVYYNEKMRDNAAVPAASIISSKSVRLDTSQSADALMALEPAIALQPEKGHFGLQATVLFGLTNRNTLDADATLSVQINTETGGIERVNLNGNARMLVDLEHPENSKGRASLNADYNVPESIFDVTSHTDIGLPSVESHDLLYATGDINLHIDPVNWYLKIGTPATPGQISLVSVLKGDSYFEVGTQIDPIPGIPARMQALFPGFNLNPAGADRNRPDFTTGSGLVHGAHLDFHAAGSFLMFDGALDALAGYDLALMKNSIPSCANLNIANPGANGWYASGQAYMGARAKIDLNIDILGMSKKFNIMNMGVAAGVKVGLPNPTWIKGVVTGDYSVLDGLVSGTFNYKFQVGNQCDAAEDGRLDIQLISDVTPRADEKEVAITAEPVITFNLKPKTFDYDDIDDKGNTIHKKLRFDRECLLVKLNNTPVTASFRNNGSYDWVYDADGLLKPSTTYTLSVTAKLKEVNEYGVESFVKLKDGTYFTETRDISFTTDEGLSSIPDFLVAETAPLHSHKAYPPAQAADGSFIALKKTINLSDFKFSKQYNAFAAVIYKNGNKQGGEIPVTINGSKWSFAQNNWEPAASYRVEIVAKTAGASAGPGIGSKAITFNAADQGGLDNKVNIRSITAGSSSKAASMVVAAFDFSTSKYNSFDDKIKGLKVSAVEFFTDDIQITEADKARLGVQNGVIKISAANTTAANKAVLDFLTKHTSGPYVLRAAHNSVVLSGDEKLNDIDVHAKTSDDIFMPSRNNFDNVTISGLYGAPTDFISATDDDIKQFVATSTGINAADLTINLRGELNPPGCPFGNAPKTYEGEFTAASLTKTGKAMQLTLPNNDAGNGLSAWINSAAGTGGFYKGLYKTSQYEVFRGTSSSVQYSCNITPAFENPVSILVNPVVNPAAGNANNAATWENVGAFTSSVKSGAVSPNGFAKGLNKAFNR